MKLAGIKLSENFTRAAAGIGGAAALALAVYLAANSTPGDHMNELAIVPGVVGAFGIMRGLCGPSGQDKRDAPAPQ
jgi:hypothetical protein